MKKLIISSMVALSLASSITVSNAHASEGVYAASVSHTFTDVSNFYNDAVSFLYGNGYAQGISDSKFGVNEKIKRVDAGVILAKYLGVENSDALPSGFTDVPQRAEKSINALKSLGITNGKTESSFGANDYITRGEVAVWFYRAFEMNSDSSNRFTDAVGIYKDAINALYNEGISIGKTNNTFGTHDNLNRGEFAVWLYGKAIGGFYKTSSITDEPATVSSASLVDSKHIQVTFSKEVEGDKLESLNIEDGHNVWEISSFEKKDGNTYVIELKDDITEHQMNWTFIVIFNNQKTVIDK